MRVVVLTVTLLCCGCMTAAAQQADSSNWKAGAAAVKITPDGPMWMAGYAARTKPSEGIAQDLFAKALAIDDGSGGRVVIVTLDLISVPGPMRAAIEKQVETRHHIPASHLLLNCSHTHCGPEIRASSAALEAVDSERREKAQQYAEALQTHILEAISQSLDKLAPVRLSYQRARAGFAMNRRTPTDKGYQNHPYPDGPVDHDVPVLRIDDSQGHLKSLLFGYACHNTTLSFYQFCGDYARYGQENLEADHSGVVGDFLMGCGGDQNPYPRGTLELARQHGRSLATAVDAALQTRPRPLTGSVRAALETVEVEYAQPPSREELEQRAKSPDKYDQQYALRLLNQLTETGHLLARYPARVQVIRLGNEVTLIALPGETVVDYSLRLKRELNSPTGPAVWVAGYSNDVFAYIPSRRVLDEGGYEAGGAMRYMTTVLQPGPFAPDIEERLVGKVHELLRRTQGTSHAK